jgi:hypothetical protein
MPSLTSEASPYDVLTPDASGMTDSTDNSEVNDPGVDDANVDDGADTDEGADQTDEGDGADTSDEGDDSADGGDPAAKAQAEADAKAEAAQWKAKEGNLPPALKELIANNPGAAKRLKEMYFTNQRLMKFGPAAEIQKMKEAAEAFGGVDKMLELKGTIDQLGGEAGLQDTVQELGAWRDIDEKWIAGDPALVSHLAESNPASFEKIAPAMFSKLGETNPELYNYLASSIITNTFANDGTITNLLLMKQALNAGDTKLAATYFSKVEGSIANLQQLASQAPKSKAPDPKAQAWEQERASYQQKDVERFQSDVQSRNDAWMAPKVNNELAAYLNGAEKKLSPNTLARLDAAIRTEIWTKHLQPNATFMKSRASLYAKKDLDGVERLYKQYADKLFPTITRQIAKEFSLTPGAKRQPGAPQKGATNKGNESTQKPDQGFTLVDKMPKPEEVDNKATSFEMKMKDQFVLKNGKKVQVRPLRRVN